MLRSILTATAAALALVPAGVAAGSAHHVCTSLDFGGDLSSSTTWNHQGVPSGAAGTFGTTTLDGQSVNLWHFPAGTRLTMPRDEIPADAYTIALFFRFDSVTGRNRVLGFKDPVVDDGLYVADGQLVFDTGTSDVKKATPTAIAAGAWSHVVLTRTAAGQVKVWLNGVLELSFADTGSDTVLANDGLRLFGDDGTEHEAGDIARVQLFDGPLDPGEVTGLSRYDGSSPATQVDWPPVYDGVRYVGPKSSWTGRVADDGTMEARINAWLEQPNGTDLTAQSSTLSTFRFDTLFVAGALFETSWFRAATGADPVVNGKPYKIAVKATDRAGNSAEQRFDAVGDTVPPTGLAISAPAEGAQLAYGTAKVSGTVPSSEREAFRTDVRICTGAVCDLPNNFSAELRRITVQTPGGAFARALELTSSETGAYPLAPGPYTVEVVSCDSAANCQTASRHFTVGAPEPAAKAGAPAPAAVPVAPAAAPAAATAPAPPTAQSRIRPPALLASATQALRGVRARTLARRGATVPFTAPGPGTATVELVAGGKVVASGRRVYRSAGSGPIVLRARRAVPRRLVVRTRFAPAAGTPVTSSGRVTLKR